MKISMRIVTLALFALCMTLFTSGAFAQTSTTGTIEGNVVDTNGNAVPGVTVTVTSPNLITPQSATTDNEGRYRILNLPPGRYAVAVAASQGFAEFKQENVEVNLSRGSSVSITLQPAGASAVVNVTDTSGANVDVTSNTTGTNVSTDQFSNFPTSRTVQGLYTIAPTTTRSGLRDASGRERDPSVGGASGPENNYILDGINTTDPAFGGSGANLPFEFVQEVEVKTGAYGAEYGKSTGGIFNVITKSGGNEVRGDAFAYFTAKSFVRETKVLPFTGSAPNGFSEIDAGGDIGGPIKKDKLWFFGAFNPQRRKNFFLTQTLRVPVENQVTTPFYAGKLTYAINSKNVFTFSTFGDFTKVEGFQAISGRVNPLQSASGFGSDPTAFLGTANTGGHNYAFRLNSTITPNMIGEFNFGLHYQRNEDLPLSTSDPQITDNFAILTSTGTIAPVTQTGIVAPATVNSNRTGNIDFIFSPGGSLQRNFLRGPGFGLFETEKRNRIEWAARLQNIWNQHTFKYGFEWYNNKYDINQASSGPGRTYGNPLGLSFATPDNNVVNGFRVTNNFSVCTTRAGQVVCPVQAAVDVFNALPAGSRPAGITGAILGTITTAEANNNPFLIRLSTRVRDFQLHAITNTKVESFYVQDDYKLSRYVQINAGLRWDYQQAYGNNSVTFIKLNSFMDNLQPRFGVIYDFTGKGKGKLFVNYARYIEAPIPLDINVRAGSEDTQTDKNFNVNALNAPTGSTIVPGISSNLSVGARNLGAGATPVDFDLKPNSVNEATAGIEYEIVKDLALGARAIYRVQGSVIEDGSFDNGDNYFLFNPGESNTERLARDQFGAGFGRARRYYRAFEVTATKRFSNNYQFIASYVFSSLIGNYEGIFRNDNGQSDPGITSLFDLVSLLGNTYGRLPNDRPHQLKFNGSYQTPFKLLLSGNFYIQSGIPFNQLIPGIPPYGDNEAFGLPRGTATIPTNVISTQGGVSPGSNRSPVTYNLDFGAYYPIQLGENRQLRFQFDWFNVTNQQKALTLDQTFVTNSGITGVPAIPNPFYGAGRIYQYPSSLRLGVKFQF